MKLCIAASTTLSLASLALASASSPGEEAAVTEAYIIDPRSVGHAAAPHSDSSQSESDPPRLSRQLARHIILQRLGRSDADDAAPSSRLLGDLPADLSVEQALTHLGVFGGREPPALFQTDGAAAASTEPSLVLMLEGTTVEAMRELRAGLADSLGLTRPSFTVADPPVAEANRALALGDLAAVNSRCSDTSASATLQHVLRVGDETCWKGMFNFVKYDLATNFGVVSFLVSWMEHLAASIQHDHLNVLLLLIPDSSRYSGPASWAPASSSPSEASELRRRSPQLFGDDQFEAVIGEETAAAASGASGKHKTGSSSPAHAFAASGNLPHRSVPACFASLSACTNGTAGCSGHGECVNRYGAESKNAPCFVCQCQVTENEDGRSRTFWAGRACSKRDISTPFWLIVGLTVVLVGMISFSIGLLFKVGEEALPGVIGAGVSRPSK